MRERKNLKPKENAATENGGGGENGGAAVRVIVL
jgi:hypothetical protein